MSFKEKLLEEWESTQALMSNFDPEKDEKSYRACAERMRDIEKQLTDLEKSENELDFRAAEIDMEAEEKKEDKKTDKKKRVVSYVLEGAKIIVPVAGAFIFGCISMAWEDTKINSTTAGKASWRDVLKFK